MTAGDREPFTQLEPPPGGAERFGRRLDERARSRRRTVPWLVGAGATAAVLVAVLYVRLEVRDEAPEQPVARIYDAPQFDRLLGRTMRPEELTVVLNDQAADLRRVETGDPRIRIYELN